MTMKLKAILTEVAAVVLCIVYSYTAYQKIFGHTGFVMHFRQVPVFRNFPTLSAITIPALEILIVLLLLLQHSRLKTLGFGLSMMLLILFTGYLSMMKLFASKLPCSCGGFISSLTFGEHIVFNLFLLTLSIVGFILNSGLSSIQISKLFKSSATIKAIF
ncbi:MauE/DoxX family redox-associated membrane protein [Chitinophaga defluvii]|uniref:MauE/DoxX family redox-associated membrane protein n=1 Tax=Chitinophaga defluvii TaxID=3163343 RepID=A0ABV2T8T4_9BACT